MMCSSWKLGVFGILALMLAFGLVTTDALAQGKGSVTVVVDDAEHAAAAEVTLLFTVNAITAPDDPDSPGVVRISIPSVWSRPVNSDDAAVADIAVGEVFITEAADITGTVSGRNLVANIGKDSTNVIRFAFKTITPHRMGTYTIPVSSSLHEGAAAITITILGAVEAGKGAFTVTRTNGPLYYQAPAEQQWTPIRRIKPATSPIRKGEDGYKVASEPAAATDYNHAGKYFVTAEKEYPPCLYLYRRRNDAQGFRYPV